MEELDNQELYCIAKVLQSILFSKEKSIFYGCRYCKNKKICMPDNIPHSDMIFDHIREKLQRITAVDLDPFYKPEKFLDHH